MLQRENLLHIIQVVYLNKGCIHSILEEEAASPFSGVDENSPLIKCKCAYPSCKNKNSNYIESISRTGISRVLSDTFINGNVSDHSPENIVKLLREYPNVGQTVFKKERSKAAFDRRYREIIILQLLAAKIPKLVFLTDNFTPSLNIATEDDKIRQPSYLKDEYWTNIYIKEE